MTWAGNRCRISNPELVLVNIGLIVRTYFGTRVMSNFYKVAGIFILLLSGCSSDIDEFEAYEQLLPRGRIAAVTEPQYVSAEEAEIADSSYVLGIVIDGQARAYSLNLLNNHEVVNDQIGELPFAAVW